MKAGEGRAGAIENPFEVDGLKNSYVPSRIVNATSFTHRCVPSMQLDEETLTGKYSSAPKQYQCAQVYEHSKSLAPPKKSKVKLYCVFQETSGKYFFGGRGRTIRSSAVLYDTKLSEELWTISSIRCFYNSSLNSRRILLETSIGGDDPSMSA
ncbi:hypothetical protein GIB67_042399 [Kingdonia uniflora]|uniref:Uncharacterized protein n=1 Tax=Kingdonia uniflora TaxID=39325 RepID=A0A7J7M8F3_9MAGN|nr:hypothetical protein GIB67_042399 [Kingdonia uniflora]